MKPAMKITNTAGPSPESALARSKPQAAQRGATFRKPANSGPSPQLGHLPSAPAMKAPPATTRGRARPSCAHFPQPTPKMK